MDIVRSRLLAGFAVVLVAGSVGACQSDLQAQHALERANLKKAVWCMELLEIELDLETAARECFAERYVQHSPHVPDGRDGVLTFFGQRIENYPESFIDIKRAAADGDLVWLHLHSKRTPDSAGTAVIHIFRMEDGRFAEHWGVGQPVRESSLHGNSMF